MGVSASPVLYNQAMSRKPDRSTEEASESRFEAAELLLDDFLARLEDGEVLDFSTFVSEHPEVETELRELYESWSRLDARLETALPEPVVGEESFFHSVGWSVTGPGGMTLPAGHAEARPGAVIGDYRLVRLLGQGGMGQVWEAEQETLGRRVALKLIRPDRSGRHVAQQLSREARAASRLDHPGIVTVYAAGEADGVPFIAQRLVGTGFHLGDAIARMRDAEHAAPPDYRKLAELFARVAEALAVAHEAGVLHRDLKPQNILIGTDDVPSVTDFGLAQVTADESSAPAGRVGTYPYMSPEQAAGKSIDERSDIFSLGAVMFEALTLRRAFEGDTPGQILERIARYDPPDARVLRSRVPRDLAVICAKALAKARGDRYQSMHALAADLRRHLRHEPIAARPEGVTRSVVKWVTRHPVISTAIALSTIALVTISALLVREVDLRHAAEEQRARANRQNYLATLRAGQQHIARGEFAEARRTLLASEPDQRGWEWGHEMLRADASVASFDTERATIADSALSGDGSRLVTSGADGVVELRDAATGEVLATWRLVAERDAHVPVDVSRDGSTIVAGTPDGRVAVFDADSRATIAEHEHGAAVLSVAISGDGRTVASGGDDGVAVVWPADGAAPLTVSPIVAAPIVSLDLSHDGARLASGSENGIVEACIVATSDIIGVNWYERGPTYVAITSDGSRVLGGKSDGTIATWDLDAIVAGAPPEDAVTTRVAHVEPIVDLAASDDGSRVATVARRGRSVRLWRAGDGAPLAELTGTPQRVASLSFAGDGSLIASGGDGGVISLFDGATRGSDVTLPGVTGTVTALATNHDGSRIVCATTPSSRVLVWKQDAGGAPRRLSGHDATVVALAIDADGRRAVSGGFDTRLRVWDLDREVSEAVLTGHAGGIEALAMSADGGRIASASRDETVRLWSGEGWSDVTVLDAHEGVVQDVALSADGRLVVSSSIDGTVRAWRPDDGASSVIERSPWFHDGVVAVSADGERIATASLRDERLRVYERDPVPDDVPRYRVVVERRTGASTLALSARGDRLVSAAFNEPVVRVWDVRNGEALALLDGHDAGVECVAISRDGARLLSGSSDRTLRIRESSLAGARALWRAVAATNGR